VQSSAMSSLIFNHIPSRVGRAGGANLMLPVFAIGLFLLVKAFSLPAGEGVLFGCFVVFCLFIGVRSYVTTLARIDFLEDRIQMFLAVYRREIFYSSIRSVKISRSTFSPTLYVKIRAKTFGEGTLLSIKGPETPFGSLGDCSARLAEEFRGKGIETIVRYWGGPK
jgi:hypothetical protein